MKIATQDLTSPVAANQLAAGAFFDENGHPGLDKPGGSPIAAIHLAGGAFFSMKMAIRDLPTRDTQTLLAEAATAADST